PPSATPLSGTQLRTVGYRVRMLPTLRDVLRLPHVQRGHPEVVAGRDHLDRPVRWVHVLELRDVSGLLRGRELVLTTGIGLPDEAADLRSYVAELSASEVAGVMVELGQKWSALPPALVRAAEQHDVPLIAMHSPVRFVTI